MTAQAFDPCALLEEVCAVARAAGAAILEIYQRSFEVGTKPDGSPVTAADRAAHDLILARLRRLTPELTVLSEESAAPAYEQRCSWTRFWLVDPLDGTREFVRRRGEFTVNIALIEDRRPVLGVVYVPMLRLAYYACRGGGAYRCKDGEAPAPIRARRYAGGRPMVATSRSHPGARLTAFLERLGPHDSLCMGSALKFCLVAEGAADLYPRLGPTGEWDTAAAQCVLEEAGGRVTDRSLTPLAYNKPSLLNPWFVAVGAGDADWARLLPEESP
jgi:3'(2'), 5'-bisphosphate nucleotidase